MAPKPSPNRVNLLIDFILLGFNVGFYVGLMSTMSLEAAMCITIIIFLLWILIMKINIDSLVSLAMICSFALVTHGVFFLAFKQDIHLYHMHVIIASLNGFLVANNIVRTSMRICEAILSFM
jgi:hypothetical protein